MTTTKTTETGQGAKHTPTPWRKHDMERSVLVCDDGRGIAMVTGRSTTDDEDAANLDLIVEAVNAHAALTEQNRKLKERLESNNATMQNLRADLKAGRYIHGEQVIDNLKLVIDTNRAALEECKPFPTASAAKRRLKVERKGRELKLADLTAILCSNKAAWIQAEEGLAYREGERK